MVLIPKRDIIEEGILIGKKGKEYEILEEKNDSVLIIDETGEEDLISERYMIDNYLKVNKGESVEIELLKEEVLGLFDNLRGKESLLKEKEAEELNSLLKDLKTFLNKVGIEE